ncbi:MAG: flagellar basal body P-ring formation chaperone FlgA [bacterium]|nr:flagellar basal body P-ring formation chaperone FlgA [bacterium]
MRVEQEVRQGLIKKYPYVEDENIMYSVINLDRVGKVMPDDAEAFKVGISERGPLLGKIVLRITFHNKEGEYIGHYSLFARVNAKANFIKTSRSLSPGEIFKKEDLNTELLELYNIPNSIVTDEDKILGKEAAFDIKSGAMVLKWMLKPVPVIRKHDVVTVKNKNKNVLVELKAVALENGELGDQIQVRVDATRRILSGEVVGTGNVEIN